MTLSALGVALSAVFLTVAMGIFAVFRWGKPLFQTLVEREWSARVSHLRERLEDVEREMEDLPRKWESFAYEAKKAQERARYHARRVKKELEARGFADDEIDAMVGSLHGIDGARGENGGLRELPDDVAEVPQLETEDPTIIALRRKWGHG